MAVADLPRPECSSDACIILGMGPQALFLVREYYHAFKKIYIIGEKNWIGYLSKYGKKIVSNERNYKENIISIINEWGQNTPILLSGGSALYYYLNNEWMHSLNCYPKPLNALVTLNDKTKLYQYTRNIGIDVKHIPTKPFMELPSLDYPMILKWATDLEVKPFKTLIIKNEEEYQNAFEKWKAFASALIVQPLIQKYRSVAWAAYCVYGKPVKEVVVHQVRQYPSGLTNYVLPLKGKERMLLQNIGSKISNRFSYSGFLELEFLQDVDSEMVYLLEGNPRPWGWIDYLKFSDTTQASMVNVVRDLYYLLHYDRKRLNGTRIRELN